MIKHLEAAKAGGFKIHIHLISGQFIIGKIVMVQKDTISATDENGKVAVIVISAISMITDPVFKAF